MGLPLGFNAIEIAMFLGLSLQIVLVVVSPKSSVVSKDSLHKFALQLFLILGLEASAFITMTSLNSMVFISAMNMMILWIRTREWSK